MHGHVVEKLLLHAGVTGVRLVELLASPHEIEPRSGAHVPWQTRQALKVLTRTDAGRIAARPTGHLLIDLPAPQAHRRRDPGSVKTPAQAVEPAGMAGAGRKALADLRDRDAPADQAPVPGLVTERHLPADCPDVARELPDARLARVVADDLRERAAAEPDRRGTQAGSLVLRRDQVGRSDGDLLGLGVTRQLDGLETIAQRRRDPVPVVRGRDEEDRGQVERLLDQRVAEAPLLGRVEHFQQDRGRVHSRLLHPA